jgi:8-oxo-dGTP diphosphatase
MARERVMAAGGIVVQRGDSPRIALVQLRKRDDWVLPKGKLNKGETPRAAAQREVLEETGHVVSVHEFLGTLAYPLGERTKVVHFWRMEAGDAASQPLMKDVTAVVWLTLDEALARLTRDHEQAFLAEVGPLAIAPCAEEPRREEPVAIRPLRRRSLWERAWRWLQR